MSQPTDINQISSDDLLRELMNARAMLFNSHGRHGIERKIELRATIGRNTQVLQRRRQQGEVIEYESHP